MAELVDAHVSGACIERCAGSSPVPGTKGETEMFLFFLSSTDHAQAMSPAKQRPRLPMPEKKTSQPYFLLYGINLAAAIAKEEEESVSDNKQKGDNKSVEVFVSHNNIANVDKKL